MPILESNAIATSDAVGSNAFAGVFGQTSPRFRHIKRVALTGGAAIGDTRVRFFLGTHFAGSYRNTTIGSGVSNPGAPAEAKDWIPVNMVAEPGEPMNLDLVTAPTTNQARFVVEYEEL